VIRGLFVSIVLALTHKHREQEVRTMWNEPSIERLSKIPRLYETENIRLQDKLIHLHFFIRACDWFIAEYDGEDLFWGFAILNDDYEMAEWGYISFSELKSISINGIEIDCEIEGAWKIRRAVEINKIRIANVWPREIPSPQEEKESDLILKVQAGHFPHSQDLFAEVTSPYSDYFSMDPNAIWEKAKERQEK
jgi:hypothetical protein